MDNMLNMMVAMKYLVKVYVTICLEIDFSQHQGK